MTTIADSFDPVKFKSATKTQWDGAAAAWYRWSPTVEQWLGAATETMLDLAGVKTGSKVLDVAAGTGGQTLAAARRLGNSGWILGTDISPKILEFALQSARSEALNNVNTMSIDAEQMDLQESNYDCAICRIGLVYFPDPKAALARIRRAVRAGCRFSTITYSTPDKNKFLSVTDAVIRRRASLPPPDPGVPGPFSLGEDGALAAILTDSGFRDVEVQKMTAPISFPNAAECVKFERECFSVFNLMLAGLEDEVKTEIWTEVETEMGQFESSAGFIGPCELLIGVGTK